MKNNIKKLFVFLLTLILIIFNILPVSAEGKAVDDTKNIIDGIVAFNLEKTNSSKNLKYQ